MKLDVNKIITESVEDAIQAKLYEPHFALPEPEVKTPLSIIRSNDEVAKKNKLLINRLLGKKKELAAKAKELGETVKKHVGEMKTTAEKYAGEMSEAAKKSAEEVGKREAQIKAEKGVSTGLQGKLKKVETRPAFEDFKSGGKKTWAEVKSTAKDVKEASGKSMSAMKEALGKHFTLDIKKMDRGNTGILAASALAAGVGALALRKRLKKKKLGGE